MHHAHYNSAGQFTKGLLGPYIVEPKDPATRPAFDREYTIVLNDARSMPPVGVVGHEGSTILVVLNGLRLLRSK